MTNEVIKMLARAYEEEIINDDINYFYKQVQFNTNLFYQTLYAVFLAHIKLDKENFNNYKIQMELIDSMHIDKSKKYNLKENVIMQKLNKKLENNQYYYIENVINHEYVVIDINELSYLLSNDPIHYGYLMTPYGFLFNATIEKEKLDNLITKAYKKQLKPSNQKKK